jgi:hypothetical protein
LIEPLSVAVEKAAEQIKEAGQEVNAAALKASLQPGLNEISAAALGQVIVDRVPQHYYWVATISVMPNRTDALARQIQNN